MANKMYHIFDGVNCLEVELMDDEIDEIAPSIKIVY